jgi:hypothetical protein
VIFIHSLLFTPLVSFFAYALIPDEVRPQCFNNMKGSGRQHTLEQMRRLPGKRISDTSGPDGKT